jgi:hypothetical protein
MALTKARTVLFSDGKRVNLFEVTHFRTKKLKLGYEFTIYWKYKASIKEEIIRTDHASFDPSKYFKQFGFAPFTENIYVNLAKIMIIEEEQVFGPVEKTKVRIVFSDGFQIIEKLESTRWSWWKSSFT